MEQGVAGVGPGVHFVNKTVNLLTKRKFKKWYSGELCNKEEKMGDDFEDLVP